MKEIVCQACGKRMPAKFNACPSCGHNRGGVITINKILYLIIFFLLAGITAYVYVNLTEGTEPIKPVDFAPAPINYSIVKEWTPNNEASRIGLHLVVSSKITPEEAHQLVDHLNIKYQRYTNVFISVFDSEEVAENYTNRNYSQEKIERHYIVQMARNDLLGINDVIWKRSEFEIIEK